MLTTKEIKKLEISLRNKSQQENKSFFEKLAAELKENPELKNCYPHCDIPDKYLK